MLLGDSGTADVICLAVTVTVTVKQATGGEMTADAWRWLAEQRALRGLCF